MGSEGMRLGGGYLRQVEKELEGFLCDEEKTK
jgi:hypothetical protein